MICLIMMLGMSFSHAKSVNFENPSCFKANTQKNYKTPLLCTACNIYDPLKAVDGNSNTYSRLSATLSVRGILWQELIFPESGRANDSIKVKIGNGNSLLNLTLLSSLKVESYNSNSANNDGGTLNGNLVDLTILSNGNQAILSFAATASFNRVRITYNPGVLGVGLLSNPWEIYEAEIAFAPPTIISQDLIICNGTAANLEVNPQGGDTVKWYDNINSTTPVGNQNTFMTPTLTTTGQHTYYVTTVRNGCENKSLKVPIYIEVKPPYSSPNLSINVVTD